MKMLNRIAVATLVWLFSVIAVFALATSGVRKQVTQVKQDIVSVCHEEKINPNIMLAIASRESDFGLTLDGDWKGDGKNGFGVFQIDRRYHKEFLDNNNWQDTRVSARYAIQLMRSNLKQFGNLNEAIAAYNCGPGNVRKAKRNGKHIDHYTTGKNYSTDVLTRARRIANPS